jgi:hypothetical protein
MFSTCTVIVSEEPKVVWVHVIFYTLECVLSLTLISVACFFFSLSESNEVCFQLSAIHSLVDLITAFSLDTDHFYSFDLVLNGVYQWFFVFILANILQRDFCNACNCFTSEKCLMACHHNIRKSQQSCEHIILNHIV